MSKTGNFPGPLGVLLVEDNPIDVFMIEDALEELGTDISLTVALDGAIATEMLFPDARLNPLRPQLIILDINLPKKSGKEVLAEIKADPDTRRIPVIMLTSSTSPDDICESYELHANCYITKPVDAEKFRATIRSIKNFWIDTVKRPD
jgi:two-component system, chemotaxis family, response regulator Rcp1